VERGSEPKLAPDRRKTSESSPVTVHAPLTMTKEAFFAWLHQREERYEYAKGRVVMMVRVTKNRSRVTTNLIVAVRSRLPANRYDIAAEAFAVDIGDSVRFPDIVVETQQADGKALEAKAPILIVEVLSPGTVHIDFGDKHQEYRNLPSLETYMIVSPDEPRVWLWHRAAGDFSSAPEIVEQLGDKFSLPALGIEIPLAEVYQGVSP
jgi:Uma2 family endonuclease